MPDFDDDEDDQDDAATVRAAAAGPAGRPGGRRGQSRDARLDETSGYREYGTGGPGGPGGPDDPGGPGGGGWDDEDDDRADRWRKIRKYSVIGALLAVLTPVVAFLLGWILISVPSPASLASERKQVTQIMASDGKTEIGRYVPEEGNRIEVPLSQVPKNVQNAVLAAEDRTFRSNLGFDFMGIGRAAWNQLRGGVGGGSTITQQYVKIATGDDSYNLWRKYREVIIATKMTKQNSKDQILENYLNTIYFGRGAYGIQAASQAYFGKNVQQLSTPEAAVLAGAIQAPSKWDPAKNPQQAMERWNFVLDGMVIEGWMPRAERQAAQYPVTVPPGDVPGSPTDSRAHIVDRVLAELEDHGINRDQLAINGGKIITSIDARAQNMARDAVLQNLDGEPKNLHSALVAVDPHTGGVTAYYGGEDGNGFDLAGGPAWNPGSAFKPFTMLAALEQGIGINAVYDGDSPLVIDGIPYHNSESRSYNALTLRDAMLHSVNTTFVQLAKDVGPQAVRQAAYQAGIPRQINGQPSLLEPNNAPPAVGITLGQYPVHTIDMASAYATFAADGTRHDPFFVREYQDYRGTPVYTHPDTAKPAFDAVDLVRNSQLARNVTATMTGVAADSKIPLDDGRQVAAKTGTNQLGDTGHNSAAWTVGYTPSISAAVWVGDPANSAIKDADGADIFGRGVPGKIWQQFMDRYLAGTPKETFPPAKLIGNKPGPAASELAPSTENKQVSASERPKPTPTPTPEQPQPTEEPKPTKTREPSSSCFPFSCDTTTNPPSGGGGNQQPPGGSPFPGGGGSSNGGGH